MSNAIHTEQLSKHFRRVEALNGMDLDVPSGAVYALVGPNGAGKTTAIKVLMNIFPATSGHATVLGMDSSRIRGKAFTSIGYVSENQQLPGWMQVRHFLAYLQPFYPTWDQALADELVRQFDLPRDRKLGKLSRGMRMKAALIGALAFHPKLVVLDEPFGGLDPLVRDELIEALVERAPETTIFISSHDLAEIENLATHLGYLESGRLRFSNEMTALSERFRELELTFEAPPNVPTVRPANWMRLETSGSVVRFIDSQFDRERSAAQVREIFGSARDVSISPMSLRAIFLALAKSARTAKE